MTKKSGTLVQIREALGLKWQEFADKLGYTNIYSYKNIENGGVQIGPQLKKRLVRLFDVNPEFLETGEGEILIQRSPGEEKAQNSTTSIKGSMMPVNLEDLKEILIKLTDNVVLMQETINIQADTIKNLELRNGRITDQLLDNILQKNEEASKKEEYPHKRSG